MSVENTLIIVTILIFTGAIFLMYSEDPGDSDSTNKIIEIPCKNLDGSIVVYKTRDTQITNRAMFSFVSIEGRKVITPSCFYEGVK